jgi:hypothetical protein
MTTVDMQVCSSSDGESDSSSDFMFSAITALDSIGFRRELKKNRQKYGMFHR